MGTLSEGAFLTLNAPSAVLCLHSGAVGPCVRQRGWHVTGQGTDRGHEAAAKG